MRVPLKPSVLIQVRITTLSSSTSVIEPQEKTDYY